MSLKEVLQLLSGSRGELHQHVALVENSKCSSGDRSMEGAALLLLCEAGERRLEYRNLKLCAIEVA